MGTDSVGSLFDHQHKKEGICLSIHLPQHNRRFSAVGARVKHRPLAVLRQSFVTLPVLVDKVPIIVRFKLKLSNTSDMRAAKRRCTTRLNLINAVGDPKRARILKPVQRRSVF
jgi:hypothetical protein